MRNQKLFNISAMLFHAAAAAAASKKEGGYVVHACVCVDDDLFNQNIDE